jgi:diguanylate cyclase (GGDEF)-like protein/PAS domain S-box-containing protein
VHPVIQDSIEIINRSAISPLARGSTSVRGIHGEPTCAVSDSRPHTHGDARGVAEDRLAHEIAFDAIVTAGESGGMTSLNPAAEHLFGALVGKPLATLFADESQAGLAQLLELARRGDPAEGELLARHARGSTVVVELRVAALSDSRAGAFVVLARDLTGVKAAEHELHHQAMHDPLTGIANRTLLDDRLTIALERAGRMGSKVAVMLLDIDDFKAVNDALGRSEGDAILVAIAHRLSELVGPGDTAARIGSDEFALLYEEVGGERGAAALAEQVVRSFRPPLTPADGVALTASVGVVMRGAGDSAESALRDAHTAASRAKANGRDRFEVFDASMRKRLIERRGLESDLRRAIEQDEIVVHYQPIVSLGLGSMDGVEALARWDHPERGLLGPREFISIAEETGLIVPLGRKVLEHACRDAARWNARADRDGPRHVSVNLSALQIAESSIVHDVRDLAVTWGLPAGQLGLEITETVVLDDNRTHLDRLEAFRAAGIRIILDDFGTGYSSLSYLRKLPLDVLKLDRSFITGIGDDAGATAIVAAVTRMADTLALSVVAEGVETLSELRALEAIGCQLVQGYFFARPMRLAKLERLLDAPPPWLTRGRPRQEPA